jgi:hypothetical protein
MWIYSLLLMIFVFLPCLILCVEPRTKNIMPLA